MERDRQRRSKRERDRERVCWLSDMFQQIDPRAQKKPKCLFVARSTYNDFRTASKYDMVKGSRFNESESIGTDWEKKTNRIVHSDIVASTLYITLVHSFGNNLLNWFLSNWALRHHSSSSRFLFLPTFFFFFFSITLFSSLASLFL